MAPTAGAGKGTGAAATEAGASDRLAVPSRSVGRLMGQGGATIKELERLTACRVRATRRDSRSEAEAEAEAQETLTEIVVRCVEAVSSRREAAAARCMRTVQLICFDALTLTDALAQAEGELKVQQQLEADFLARAEEQQMVRRIRIDWPEFDEVDVLAAVQEAGVMFEDAAIDLLHEGYRAPVSRNRNAQQQQDNHNKDNQDNIDNADSRNNRDNRGQRNKDKAVRRNYTNSHSCPEHEEFPALSGTSPALGGSTNSAIHLGRPGMWSRRLAQNKTEPSAARSFEDEFPGLPVSVSNPVPVRARAGPGPGPGPVMKRCAQRNLRLPLRGAKN